MNQPTIAVILSNRNFFPDILIREARQDLVKIFAEVGIKTIILGEQDTELGALETWQDAIRCADFKNELRNFISVCNVVRGLKGARIGAVGARPNAFIHSGPSGREDSSIAESTALHLQARI